MAAGDGKYPIKSIWVTANPATLRQKLTFGGSDPAEATVFSSWYLGNGELIAEAGSYNITGSEATLEVQRVPGPNFVFSPRRRQPQANANFAPDLSHPLLQAIGAIVVWNGATPRFRYSPVNTINSTSSYTGTGVITDLRSGSSTGVSLVSASLNEIDLGAIPSFTQFTLLVIATQPSAGGIPIATNTASGTSGFDILQSPAGVAGRVISRVVPSIGQDSNSYDGLNDGKAHKYLSTWRSGDFIKLYVDSPRLSGNGTGTTSGTVSPTQNLKIGRRGSTYWSGSVSLVIFGTKQNISAGLELLENPWQIFKDEFKLFYVGTTTNNVVLNAETGVYNLTGAAADLTATRTLSADSGAYNLTGSAATLEKTIPLDAASGSYSLTGSSATLAKELNLSADSGSYNVTGFAADLTYAAGVKVLIAEPGAYSLVGSDATLAKSLNLSADSGAYNLTGAAATLYKDVPLSADPGSYQIDGKDASLTQGKQVLADPGSYQVDGQAATFIRTYNLLAASGAFNVTGSDATLATEITLLAGSGSYLLTGASANLIKFSLFPDPSDVRAGVVYGPGGIYVGTLTVGGKVLYIFDD